MGTVDEPDDNEGKYLGGYKNEKQYEIFFADDLTNITLNRSKKLNASAGTNVGVDFRVYKLLSGWKNWYLKYFHWA